MTEPVVNARIACRTLLKSAALAALAAAAGCAEIGAPGPLATQAHSHQPDRAKNVIIFIGDGMGVSTVTGIRILAGQMQGDTGEEHVLSWETFPNVALSKTYNTNQQVPDSAGTATSIMSGVKTKAGFIGVGPAPKRTECDVSLRHHLTTVLEEAENRGLSTGVVTTARLTHATPASTYAHVPERDWEADADMPAEALAQGCKDIASQLIDTVAGDGVEVAMGGGRANFLPESVSDPEYESKKGKRKDGRNLPEEWVRRDGAAYAWNEAQFNAVDSSSTKHLLGLFEPGHMKFSLNRPEDKSGEPSLSAMTEKAIEILGKNEQGYFLLVEGGRIDHGHHEGIAAHALHDGVAMAEAVAMADKLTSDDDTLIIVTADHSHTFTLAGYPTRGNPILGKVIGNDDLGEPNANYDLLDDGLPYTSAGYQNGPGAVDSLPRPDLTNIDTEAETFHQQSLIPRSSETHGGEDVAVYAKGPGAERARGVLEQNEIHDIMTKALGLNDE